MKPVGIFVKLQKVKIDQFGAIAKLQKGKWNQFGAFTKFPKHKIDSVGTFAKFPKYPSAKIMADKKSLGNNYAYSNQYPLLPIFIGTGRLALAFD